MLAAAAPGSLVLSASAGVQAPSAVGSWCEVIGGLGCVVWGVVWGVAWDVAWGWAPVDCLMGVASLCVWRVAVCRLFGPFVIISSGGALAGF